MAQARAGDAGGSGIMDGLESRKAEVRSPTLSGAPLAQRQSNGLLIRRFRVQIPGGAPVQRVFLVFGTPKKPNKNPTIGFWAVFWAP